MKCLSCTEVSLTIYSLCCHSHSRLLLIITFVITFRCRLCWFCDLAISVLCVYWTWELCWNCVMFLGELTTPQLHYIVCCINTLGAYGQPSAAGYYTKLSTAFTELHTHSVCAISPRVVWFIILLFYVSYMLLVHYWIVVKLRLSYVIRSVEMADCGTVQRCLWFHENNQCPWYSSIGF